MRDAERTTTRTVSLSPEVTSEVVPAPSPRPIPSRVAHTGVVQPPAAPSDTPVALDAVFDEDGPLDTDPLTISSSDTVPLFGLAPERVQQPGGSVEPPQDEARDPAPTVAWVLATVALLVTLAVAGALFLV